MSDPNTIIHHLREIINSYTSDNNKSVFDQQLGKIVPVITEYLHAQNIAIDSQARWKLPNDSLLDEASKSPDKNPAVTPPKSEGDSDQPITPSQTPLATSISTPSNPVIEKVTKMAAEEELKKMKAKEYREISRKANPHLARARSLIARAKYLLGASANHSEIISKALELLNTPGRVPKPEYQFDTNGVEIVAAMIRNWKPRS